MVTIIPAILETTEQEYKQAIENINSAPSLEDGWLHIDFMDGFFVDNHSIEPAVVSKYPTNLKKEAHLMVMQPINWLDKLIEAGFTRVILHFEAEEVQQCLEYLTGKGLEVGLAVKMETQLDKIQEFLPQIDLLLIMSIKPGFQGQPFIPDALEKITEANQVRAVNNFSIAVDGAVSTDNIKSLVAAGADILIIGSHLVQGDIEENMEKVWEVVNT